MLKVHSFTFNPFQENTYLISGPGGQCLVIDPGMSNREEETLLIDYLRQENLTPVMLVNTHCHIDHILGNHRIHQMFGLPLAAHRLEQATLDRADQAAMLFGVNYTPSPPISVFLDEGQTVELEGQTLEVVFVPGHAPGHIALINHSDQWVMGGDVLFRNSVGRVDLPGCDARALVDSIRNKFYTLPDAFVVHPGHGPATTIGFEKEHNYFVNQHQQQLYV
ncbi:MAG: MBL fold metallo-hydrolase [Flavobacteriales bacterium]|nr:MBL fold metallo-hydrolase [Flavobacteriales bacterium]